MKLLFALAAAAALAHAAHASTDHAWITSPLRVAQPETYFTNLKDGASIETPFVLKFGVSRYGIAAIDKSVPRTGHHHLLVNRDLPLDFKQPLPFNDQYIHFGRGQMETVLTFKPGAYTLRLLLADDKHIPLFVYSKPLHITVTKKNDGIDPKSLSKPGLEILSPASGETVSGPFRMVLHASALNVSHHSITDARAGHFRIVAERAGAVPERIELANGATEAWLKPPAGDYRMKVEWMSNAQPGQVLATSEAIQLRVKD
jgi:hypothetical protein